MKKTFLLIVCIIYLCNAKAQVAKWLIAPVYDSIYMADGIDAVMTDSADKKNIWSLDGMRLADVHYNIHPFYENLAVSTRQDAIVGFYNSDGTFTELKGFVVAHSYPYFSEGKLLVKDATSFRFVNADGKVVNGKYIQAFPFFNGYATCYTYRDFESLKHPYRLLLDTNNEIVTFSFNGKIFAPDDIDFISSVNDENIGIVVIRSKIFFFNGTDRTLSPVYANQNETNIKKQAKLKKSDIAKSMHTESNNVCVLSGVSGKSDNVSIRFNSAMKPVSIICNGHETVYQNKNRIEKSYTSPLQVDSHDGLYGLSWDNVEMLPAQFEKVVACFDDKALVKLNGKFGMLSVNKAFKFRIKINKNDNIAFRHQKFETIARLDMPASMPTDKVYMDIDSRSGCELDKPSREAKETESGNYIQYNCTLHIPLSLPDTLTEIEYPIQIQYYGLKSPIIPFRVKAWHCKYFVVDVDNSQTTLENGVVSIVFNINADRIASDLIYPTAIDISTDSLQYDVERMSETRFKCKVFDLNEGINNIVVNIVEEGCPPASFPYEIEYHKPVPKTKTQAAQSESFMVKPKEKKRPYIEI